MIIKAENFNGKDTRISFVAENYAEGFQLNALKESLNKAGTEWTKWNDCEGLYGITVTAKLKESEAIE